MNDSQPLSEQLEVLGIVCRRLNVARIPYMVTGSIAASFYGIPRMTRDIDIVIELEATSAAQLHALFQNDFYADLPSIEEESQRTGMFNIIHDAYSLKVDFIVRKTSEYRQLEFDRRRAIPVRDFECSIVRIEDLILSKLYWARSSLSELQLRDVRDLLASRNPIDIAYIETWVDRLGLTAVYERAVE